MTKKKSPFYEIGQQLKEQNVSRFRANSLAARKYIKEIKGPILTNVFIGWLCERDTFFAYMYKQMKKDARDKRSVKLASKVSRAGFPVMVPEIENWISSNKSQTLIVPIPSRYGISEQFAKELYQLLNKEVKKISHVQNLLEKSTQAIEMKRLDSWAKRKRVVNELIILSKKVSLENYSILLVDDIVTSGSSLRRSASLLKKAGANEVAAVSLTTNLFDSFSYKTK